MTEPPSRDLSAVPEPLRSALAQRGFVELTAVQAAVLDPALAGRDLRISSETGSGKTVAVGFVVAPTLPVGATRPRALVIAPTRELAAQVRGELAWLFDELGVRVVAVTGGTDARNERRELDRGAAVVVGTPGRLLDHLERGALDTSEIASVVLDEADQMLDLGFRDDLEAILGKLPASRSTHLVSATFSREVMSLADRYQRNAANVEGTRLGDANESITHVIHLVREDQRFDALFNILLEDPDARTLIFVRTRRDTSDLTERLVSEGIRAAALSGDMEQEERTRTLAGFRTDGLRVLVATDVAARGLDVPDIGRVIHADPPNDSDTYTHRSGRTGRAGRTGVSATLATVASRGRVVSLLRRAGVSPTFAPVPSARDIQARADSRLAEELLADLAPASPHVRALAARLLTGLSAEDLALRLLERVAVSHGPRPRHVDPVHAPEPPRFADRRDGPPRSSGVGPRRLDARGFVPFRVTWGARHGADPRRLLALVCRRGRIQGSDVGTMKIGPVASMVEVSAEVAEAFARAASEPDSRDPRVRIGPVDDEGPPPRSYDGPKRRSSSDEGFKPRAPHAERPAPADRPAYERPAHAERPAPERPAHAERAGHERPAEHAPKRPSSRRPDAPPAPAERAPAEHPKRPSSRRPDVTPPPHPRGGERHNDGGPGARPPRRKRI
ncbi:MAG: DEAD/DEAH box helicase [Myxococcales bacterium]|nr:DEAD/DEAH box helicase [Myxococcales bacterium]